jgi:hypothetical protein
MDQKKVRNKLIKFLMKRPTLQSVKEKGYFRGTGPGFLAWGLAVVYRGSSLSSMSGDPLRVVPHHAAEKTLNTPKMFYLI